MSNRIKAAFLVVAPETNSEMDRSTITSSVVELITVLVKDYDEAEKEAIKLVEEGVAAIELCAGFGNEGVYRISKAISNKIPVGVVRFDNHPAFDNQSGDNLF